MPTRRPAKRRNHTQGGFFPALIPLGIGLASAIAGAAATKGMDILDRKISGKGMAARKRRAPKTLVIRV